MRPVMLAVVWLASLGGVFFLGLLLAFAFHRDPGAGLSADSSLAERELAVILERLTGQPADLSAVFDPRTRGDELPPAVQAAWVNLLAEREPAARLYLARQLARALPPSLVARSVRFLAETPPNDARRDILTTLLEQWAMRDGRSAITFAQTVLQPRPGEDAVLAALAGWAQDQPRAAWDWAARTGGPTTQRANRLAEVAWMAAYDETVDPMAWMAELEEPRAQREVLVTLTDFFLQTDPPEGVARRLGNLPEGDARDAAKAHLSHRWAQEDPAAAMNWAETLTFGPARRETLQVVANAWIAQGGVQDVASWVNQQRSHADLDGVAQAIALAVVERDGPNAIAWAQTLTNDEDRGLTTTLVIDRWLARAPEAAAQIAEAFPALVAYLPAHTVPVVAPDATTTIHVEEGETLHVSEGGGGHPAP